MTSLAQLDLWLSAARQLRHIAELRRNGREAMRLRAAERLLLWRIAKAERAQNWPPTPPDQDAEFHAELYRDIS
jgi:hypothetical protein